MTKTILLLTLLLTGGLAFGAEELENDESQNEVYPFLGEGFEVADVDGTVSKVPGQDRWVFTAQEDITDTRGVIKAGQEIEVLRSSTLEKITDMAGEEKSIDVKLWARVTRYCNMYLSGFEEDEGEHIDKNYLFPFFFIPMSDTQSPEISDDEDEVDEGAEPKEEDSIIPSHVMKKLKPKRVVNLVELKKVVDKQSDVTLVDRTGFVIADEDDKVFATDSLGRNIEDMRFRLLPCESLQYTEFRLAKRAGRQKYRVAGIVTKYKGEYYMLLHRSIRTYSHGNFSR